MDLKGRWLFVTRLHIWPWGRPVGAGVALWWGEVGQPVGGGGRAAGGLRLTGPGHASADAARTGWAPDGQLRLSPSTRALSLSLWSGALGVA